MAFFDIHVSQSQPIFGLLNVTRDLKWYVRYGSDPAAFPSVISIPGDLQYEGNAHRRSSLKHHQEKINVITQEPLTQEIMNAN